MKPKKINILYIITGLELGGAEILLLDILRNIDRDKFDCAVLYLKGNGDIKSEIVKLNITTFDNSKYSFINPLKYLHIFWIIKKHHYDIIHSHLIHSNIISRVIGKASGVKIIINSEHNTSNWHSDNFIMLTIYRMTLRFVDIIHCISNSVKDNLIKYIKVEHSRLKIIYDGICVEKFDKKKRNFEKSKQYNQYYPIIGCISRLDKRKGIEYLIKAVKSLKLKYENIKVILVGDGPEREFLTKLVNELDLLLEVEFIGKSFEIEKYLWTFDVFVLPSLQEGLSIAVIEAMASGVPVIATNTGGLPEVISNNYNGLLVKPSDEHEIVMAINNLIINNELRKILTQNAIITANEKFNIKKIIKEFEHLYLDLSLRKGLL